MAHASPLGAWSSTTLSVPPGWFPRTVRWLCSAQRSPRRGQLGSGSSCAPCSTNTRSTAVYESTYSSFYNICICLKAVRRKQVKERELSQEMKSLLYVTQESCGSKDNRVFSHFRHLLKGDPLHPPGKWVLPLTRPNKTRTFRP